MTKGYVYVLTNEAMPGLVKIGKTTRSVDQRATEIDQTGVPSPFVVEYKVYCPDCDGLELSAHEFFDNARVRQSREFFAVKPCTVQNYLEGKLHEQVQDLVAEFLPDHDLYESHTIIDPSDVADAAMANGLKFYEIKGVLSQITGEEMAPLVSRFRRWETDRTKLMPPAHDLVVVQ